MKWKRQDGKRRDEKDMNRWGPDNPPPYQYITFPHPPHLPFRHQLTMRRRNVPRPQLQHTLLEHQTRATDGGPWTYHVSPYLALQRLSPTPADTPWLHISSNYWFRIIHRGRETHHQHGIGHASKGAPEIWFTCRMQLRLGPACRPQRDGVAIRMRCEMMARALVKHKEENNCGCGFGDLVGRDRGSSSEERLRERLSERDRLLRDLTCTNGDCGGFWGVGEQLRWHDWFCACEPFGRIIGWAEARGEWDIVGQMESAATTMEHQDEGPIHNLPEWSRKWEYY